MAIEVESSSEQDMDNCSTSTFSPVSWSRRKQLIYEKGRKGVEEPKRSINIGCGKREMLMRETEKNVEPWVAGALEDKKKTEKQSRLKRGRHRTGISLTNYDNMANMMERKNKYVHQVEKDEERTLDELIDDVCLEQDAEDFHDKIIDEVCLEQDAEDSDDEIIDEVCLEFDEETKTQHLMADDEAAVGNLQINPHNQLNEEQNQQQPENLFQEQPLEIAEHGQPVKESKRIGIENFGENREGYEMSHHLEQASLESEWRKLRPRPSKFQPDQTEETSSGTNQHGKLRLRLSRDESTENANRSQQLASRSSLRNR